MDRSTGSLLACTIAIHTARGEILTDSPQFAGGIRSAGEFLVTVPPGETTVVVTRGFDFVPRSKRISIRAGEQARMRFSLERISPLRKNGWYCGDSHIHMIHGERRIAVSFADVALAGRASGLDYLSLAQQWNLPEISTSSLDQACAGESTTDFHMTWNLEAPKNYWHGDASQCLGHGWTLGMRGPDAIREVLDLSAWDYDREKAPVPNFEIHALIHELGGIVSYTHPCRWWRGKWGGQSGYPVTEDKFISNLAQELPFDTLAGPTYDTLDILMQPQEEAANSDAQRLWFLLLNHGYRIAGTASSDSTFDNPDGAHPGEARVYTRLSGPFAWDSLEQAMKSGKNLATTGPLIQFQIVGREPGDTIPLSGRSLFEAEVRAWVAVGSLTKVEVIQDGEVVRTFSLPPGKSRFHARFRIEAVRNGWCLIRCFASGKGRVALTNPIYFAADGYTPPMPVEAVVEATVRDKRTGAALSGTWESLQMTGLEARKVSQGTVSDGVFSTTAPATARLRVSVPGYGPLHRSILLDDSELRDLTINMRPEQLLDWGTFEQVRTLLGHVKLEFLLDR